jgi:D-lactate dehydrogenase (cytochrome)
MSSAPSHTLRSRAPHGAADVVAIRDPEVLASYLRDAAHVPGGHASTLYMPATEAAIATVLRSSSAVLPVGAQSSLTGGATPMGEALISTSRWNRSVDVAGDRARTQAGVTLVDLDRAIAPHGLYYPPAPTFTGAFVGGTVSTNAAGAATFKYGTTRRWVHALTVVLATGDVLDIDRGVTFAHPDGYFDLALEGGPIRVPVPRYLMPNVQKLSAGYFAAPGMDLIDLFIGSEGTLGIITEVTLALTTRPPQCLAFVTFADAGVALAVVGQLRNAALETRRLADPHGLDVSAIEHMDRRCLELLREDGIDRQLGVTIPTAAEMAILVTLELAAGTTAEMAYDEIARAADPDAPDAPLVRFCALLADHGALEDTIIAPPGDAAGAAQLINLREAVPAAVNRRIGRAQQDIDGQIAKTAADTIVPFDKLTAFLTVCRDELRARGLDAAIWGHVSDGNLHPNVIPRSIAEMEQGREAILALGEAAIRLGGAPLAEHGVGRNAVKQRLLAELYGARGVDEMRRVKAVLDPEWKLSPGVLFAR